MEPAKQTERSFFDIESKSKNSKNSGTNKLGNRAKKPIRINVEQANKAFDVNECVNKSISSASLSDFNNTQKIQK